VGLAWRDKGGTQCSGGFSTAHRFQTDCFSGWLLSRIVRVEGSGGADEEGHVSNLENVIPYCILQSGVLSEQPMIGAHCYIKTML